MCFDEISGISFDKKDGINIMKGYMESGEFSRGKESIRAKRIRSPLGRCRNSRKRLLANVIMCALPRHVESSGANPDRRCSSQPEALGAVQEVTNGLKHSKKRLR